MKIQQDGVLAYLNTSRQYLQGASTPDYAIFYGGGRHDGNDVTGTADCDAYNKNFTRISCPSLASSSYIYKVYRHVSAEVGNYAIFHGGQQTNSYSNEPRFGVYNNSLTEVSLSSLPSSVSTARTGGIHFNNYAIFGGSGTSYPDVYAINASLSKIKVGDVDYACRGVGLVTLPNYVLLPGGASNISDSNIVQGFNKSFTKTTIPNLTYGRAYCIGATAGGKYAIINGGDAEDKAECYNNSLTKTNIVGLGVRMAATEQGITLGDYAIFAGGYEGYINTLNSYDNVWIYDSQLTQTISTLSARRVYYGHTILNNYAFIAGGTRFYDDNGGELNTIEFFHIE